MPTGLPLTMLEPPAVEAEELGVVGLSSPFRIEGVLALEDVPLWGLRGGAGGEGGVNGGRHGNHAGVVGACVVAALQRNLGCHI